MEFALSFILFLLMTVIGVMDLGRGIWAYNLVAHASHEAVRYAMVHGSKSQTPATEDDIAGYVRRRTFILEPGGGVAVTTTWVPDNSPGSTVRVRVEHEHRPFFTAFLGKSFHLSSTAEMVISQ